MLNEELRAKVKTHQLLLEYALNDLGSLDDWLVGAGFVREVKVSEDVPNSLTVICSVMSDVAHPVIEFKGRRLAYWHKAKYVEASKSPNGLELEAFTLHSMRIILVPLVHKDGI